jgi:hypothetical protein
MKLVRPQNSHFSFPFEEEKKRKVLEEKNDLLRRIYYWDNV